MESNLSAFQLANTLEEFGKLPDQFITDMVKTVHLIDLDLNEIKVLCCAVAEE